MFIWSVDYWTVYFLNISEVILNLFLFSCPGSVIEPGELFCHWIFQLLEFFWSADSFESRTIKVILERVKGRLKVISDFCLFFNVVLLFFVFWNNFSQGLKFLFWETIVFRRFVIGFQNKLFTLDLELFNHFLYVSGSFSHFFLSFLFTCFLSRFFFFRLFFVFWSFFLILLTFFLLFSLYLLTLLSFIFHFIFILFFFALLFFLFNSHIFNN